MVRPHEQNHSSESTETAGQTLNTPAAARNIPPRPTRGTEPGGVRQEGWHLGVHPDEARAEEAERPAEDPPEDHEGVEVLPRGGVSGVLTKMVGNLLAEAFSGELVFLKQRPFALSLSRRLLKAPKQKHRT